MAPHLFMVAAKLSQIAAKASALGQQLVQVVHDTT